MNELFKNIKSFIYFCNSKSSNNWEIFVYFFQIKKRIENFNFYEKIK